ncbi:MAG: glycosyltransferase, partial [Candidatus Omnitrophota bacterium]
EKAVDVLSPEIKLLVVCGRNRRLYERIKRKNYGSVRLFGFVEGMQGLMSQADIIITKPGGSTIAEALAMELPLVFIKGIPGQETENARILRAYGCAIAAERLKSLKDIVTDLKTHPQMLESMRNNIRKVKKSNAAEEICRYVKEICTLR